MAMTKVSEVTVGSGGAASIEFTSIPQTGKDLLVLLSARDTGSIGGAAFLYFNGNTSSSNYSYRHLNGSGSAATSTNFSGDAWYLWRAALSLSGDTASTFGNALAYISNYTSATAKSISSDGVTENNATAAKQSIGAGLWNQTAAITAIGLLAEGANFAQNSTASLYIVS